MTPKESYEAILGHIQAVTTELDALKAKLPTSKNGVTLAPGDPLWFLDDRGREDCIHIQTIRQTSVVSDGISSIGYVVSGRSIKSRDLVDLIPSGCFSDQESCRRSMYPAGEQIAQ